MGAWLRAVLSWRPPLWPTLGLAAVVGVLAAPEAAAVVLGAVLTVAGPLAVWAATQPVLITFAAGLFAGRRWAARRGEVPL